MSHVFLSFTLALLSALSAQDVEGVQITDLRVPQAVQNASGTPAILDCEYSLRPDELSAESGLVIKWFFNNGPVPVYQWIPNQQKPQDLGILRGKLKLDYKASHHDATMHRALYIRNPTTELSGDYKCFVSTFIDEDFMNKHMVVYAPEKRMDVTQVKEGMEKLNISCRAQGVFPEPKLSLFKKLDEKKRIEIPMMNMETYSYGGVFDVSGSTLLHGEEVESDAVYGCELTIPGTSYKKSKLVNYPSVSGAPAGGAALSMLLALLTLANPC